MQALTLTPAAFQTAIQNRMIARTTGRDLRNLIMTGRTRLPDVAALLDGLESAERIQTVRGLGPAEQRRLWDMAEGSLATLTDFVPAGTPPLTLVRHFGMNTLPVHSYFEKRFAYAPVPGPGDTAAGRTDLWGFNYQALMDISGPGYFIAYEDPQTRSLAIDYRAVPPYRPEGPGGWPALKDNEHGLGYVIHGGMVDHMRKVSANVTIGRAQKHGKWIPAWFVLTRENIPF